MHKNTCAGALFLTSLWTIVLAGCRAEGPVSPGESEIPVSPSVELVSMDPPAAVGSMAPRLAQSRDGVLLTWLEKGSAPESHDLKMARWDGATWNSAKTLASGERFFANWADLPSVVETSDGTLVAHWLQMLGENTYDYGVELTRSAGGGESWQPLGLLHDDRTAAEHGFVSMVSSADGAWAFWLDGREMPSGGDMQLRGARLEPDNNFEPGPSTVIDDRVCECCSTDAALTSTGPVVVYRDRGEDEIRDISIVRWLTGADGEAAGWSAPRVLAEDDWQIHGCPVNGPAIAARGDLVAVAWFSAPDGQSRVRLAFSDDAGVTFEPPVEIDADGPLGRVDLELDGEGRALVIWLATREDAGEIRLSRVSRQGEARFSQTVFTQTLVTTTTRRSAGVPRLIRSGSSEVLLAWVEDGDVSRVRVARLLLP